MLLGYTRAICCNIRMITLAVDVLSNRCQSLRIGCGFLSILGM